MRTAIKRCVAMLLTLLLLPLGAVLQVGAADDLPDPPRGGSCVYDPAGVIDSDTKQLIDENSRALYALSGAQIMVVAIDKTGYSDLSEYANDLFNHWGIGDAKENNGVLFVMELSTYKYWAALGYGLESKITSAILQRIFDSGMETAFDNQEYDRAAKIFCEKITEALEQSYSIDVSRWDGTTFYYGSSNMNGPAGGKTGGAVSVISTIFSGIIGLLITLAVIAVVIFALLRSSCCACGGPGYYGGPRYRRPFWGGYHHHHHHYGPGPRPGGPRPGSFGGGRTGGFGGGRAGGGMRPGGGGSRGAGGGRR